MRREGVRSLRRANGNVRSVASRVESHRRRHARGTRVHVVPRDGDGANTEKGETGGDVGGRKKRDEDDEEEEEEVAVVVAQSPPANVALPRDVLPPLVRIKPGH